MGAPGSLSATKASACQAAKREWDEHAPDTRFVRHDAEELLVRIDARAPALKGDGVHFAPLERPRDRLPYVFHIGRLQSGKTAAEHRIDQKPAQKQEDGREKRVILAEHHRRADENGIGERGPHRQLAFAALADIRRWRGRIGSDSRDVDEPFDPGPTRSTRYAFGSVDVYGVKSLPSALDVKTDGIDRAVSAVERSGNQSFVMNVGCDRVQPRIIGTEQCAPAIRMPGCDPNGKILLAQMSHDAAAQKAGSAKNCHDAHAHDPIK
jgi:hypothetical protein